MSDDSDIHIMNHRVFRSYAAPEVSVITPAFNAAKFLPRLIETVRRQKGVPYEHLIIDDCSTDNSREVLETFAKHDSRIKILSTGNNAGPIVARNLGVESAKGRFLAFLDADDFWLPDKLFIQTEFMKRTGATASFTDYRHVSEDGRLIGRLVSGPNHIGWKTHHCSRFIGCLTVMIDRTKVPDFSFGNISPAYRAEDFLAWSDCIRKFGPMPRCPHDLARYSVVEGSRSSNAIRAATSVWKLYHHVEQIPLAQAGLYFPLYGLFVLVKRLTCRPNKPRDLIDSDFAHTLIDA